MKVGILTGGGDAPGFNAVIYGALLRAYKEKDIEVIGIKKGWEVFTIPKEKLSQEVIEKYTQVLDISELDDLHVKGGTIIYTSRSNPFKDISKFKTEQEKESKRKEIALDLDSKFKILGIEALIAVGGDDTCGVAAAMYKYANSKIVACPKTIDNDLSGTDYTFGFFSGAQLASNNLDNLTTTAHSHQRIMIVEIMGRDAGWLTLYSGLAAGADVILLPEMPFDFEKHVVEVLKNRANAGYKYHIIACSEGAYPSQKSIEQDFKVVDMKKAIEQLPKDAFGNPLLNQLNISGKLEKELSARKDLEEFFKKCDSNFEVRSVVLGHTMRAGSPNVFDRILGLRYGYHAMDYIIKGNYGKMTALKGTEIVPVDLIEGSKKKYIDPNSDLIELMKAMISVKHKSKEKLFK